MAASSSRRRALVALLAAALALLGLWRGWDLDVVTLVDGAVDALLLLAVAIVAAFLAVGLWLGVRAMVRRFLTGTDRSRRALPGMVSPTTQNKKRKK